MVEHTPLREAIDQLPEREKMTILLRFFKGLTQEQTARDPGGVPGADIPAGAPGAGRSPAAAGRLRPS